VNDLNRRSAAQSRNAMPNEVSGVLETIAAGLSLLIARPWLLVLPLIVDLVTWLGVQVSAQPLITSMQELMIEQGGTNGPAAAEELGNIGEQMRVNDILASLTPSIFSGLPNDTLLSGLLGVLVPAMTGGVDRSNLYSGWGDGLGRHIVPGSGLAVIGWSLLFFLGATFLLALFKAPVAQAVRGGSTSISMLVKDVAMGWVRILALVGIVIASLVVLFIPFLLAALAVALLGINLVAVLSLAIFVFGSIGAIYLYFLLDAMFIYRVGPIRAARMSYAVARLNFAQAWRFAATSILIASGVLQVWNVLIENPPGIVISLLLNAALGTGLSIASMMFFHDRARLPRPVLPTRQFPTTRPF
jgi:hypothetical protein